MPRYEGIINRYRAFLPIGKNDAVITLYEGNTPLHESHNLRNAINPELSIFLKFEGLNPTGSFKDRGMTMAVTQAYNSGSRKIICASTGNTSASAAAYAANSGMEAYVLIPDGKIALGKMSQGMRYGAKVIQIRGNFDDALQIVRDISADGSISLVNSVNPYRIQGQKTASFEVIDELGFAPDYHALPVGNAGNITAYWMGYKEYFDAVTDDEILEAYNMLACLEGVFCEPASAASVAGIIKLNRAGHFKPGDRIVCTLTGNGLKDPDTAMKGVTTPVTIDASEDAVRKLLDS
jgi:threonine synthase